MPLPRGTRALWSGREKPCARDKKGPSVPSSLGGDPVPHIGSHRRGPSHYAPMQGTKTTHHQVGRIPRPSLPPRHGVDREYRRRQAGALLARKSDCCCLLADLWTQGGGPPHEEALRPGRDYFGMWMVRGRVSARMKPCGAGPLVSLDPGHAWGPGEGEKGEREGRRGLSPSFQVCCASFSQEVSDTLDSPRPGCALRPSAPLPGCRSFSSDRYSVFFFLSL